MTRARGASRPRFRLLPTVLLTLAILLLPTVVYALGRSSSSFDITTVTVAGTHLVPEKQALKLLRRDYAGSNLFTVTAADVRETLAPLCFVSGVTVDRDFPDTLAIGLTEYEPAAYALAGDRWYVLDRHGFVICRAAQAADQLDGKAAKPSASPSPSATEGDGATRLIAGPGRPVLPLPRIAVKSRVRVAANVGDAEAVDMLSRDRGPAALLAAPAAHRRHRRRPDHAPLRRRAGGHVGRRGAHAGQDRWRCAPC